MSMKPTTLKDEHSREMESFKRMHKALVDLNRHRKQNPHSNVNHILEAYPPEVLREKILSQAKKIRVLEKKMKAETMSSFIKTAVIFSFASLLMGISFYL